MTISIVINNFNYGKFVGQAIESALKQTYPAVEVIVVDDGSTDNSWRIIKSFDGKVSAISKPNEGQASAFNVGYEASSGNIVVFLDSDDLLYPNALEQIAINWSPDLSKLHYPLDVIDEGGNHTGQLMPWAPLERGDLLPRLLSLGVYNSAPTSGNAFSRAFLEKVMPVPSSWTTADTYLIFLAPFYGQIGKVDGTLGEYRVHSSSLSLSATSMNGRFSLKRLRHNVARDVRQLQLVQSAAEVRGLSVSKNNELNGYGHYKFRLACLKLDPNGHPIESDSLLGLAKTLLTKAWADRRLRLSKKLACTIWTILVVVTPMPLAVALVHEVSPQHRTPLLHRLAKTSRATH